MSPRERERPDLPAGATHNNTSSTVRVPAWPVQPPVEVIYEVTVVIANGTERRTPFYSRSAAERAVERARERGREARLTRRRFMEVAPRVRDIVAQSPDHELWADVVLRGVLLAALAHELFELDLDSAGDGVLGQAAANLLDLRDLLELAARKGWGRP